MNKRFILIIAITFLLSLTMVTAIDYEINYTDDYSTDTRSNYIVEGDDYWTVTGGVMEYNRWTNSGLFYNTTYTGNATAETIVSQANAYSGIAHCYNITDGSYYTLQANLEGGSRLLWRKWNGAGFEAIPPHSQYTEFQGSLVIQSGKDYNMKVEHNSSGMFVKAWDIGDSEPSTWNANTSTVCDSPYYFGFNSKGNVAKGMFDNFTISTQEAGEPPVEPPTGNNVTLLGTNPTNNPTFSVQSDTSVTTGLGDIGNLATPEMWKRDGKLYMWSGEGNAVLNAYEWNETANTWQTTTDYKTGIGTGNWGTYEVFNFEGDLYSFHGENGGLLEGYKWNGTSWNRSSYIENGLPSDIGEHAEAVVFEIDGTYNLITGASSGTYEGKGYTWNGSSWIANNTVHTGISLSGAVQMFDVFIDVEGNINLLQGGQDGRTYSYVWNGAGWSGTDTYEYPLIADVGDYSAITGITNLDNTEYWFMVGGQDGNFDGYSIPIPIDATVDENSTVITIDITTAPESFTLPSYVTGTYNYSVNWGDGTTNDVTTWSVDRSHTFYDNSSYDIVINGVFNGVNFGSYDCTPVIEIKQFGNLGIGSSGSQFMNCPSLNITDTTNNITLNGNNYRVFYASTIIGNLSLFEVSQVTSFDEAFRLATGVNQNLSGWNTSSVTNMGSMFFSTDFNQDINSWDTSNVVDMGSMFYTSDFNQPLNNWDVSSVTDFSLMFQDTPFNQNINTWNTISATNFNQMFKATPINQAFDNFDFTSVTSAYEMFEDVTLSTTNYDDLLSSMANQLVNNNVIFDGGNSKYSDQTSRDILTNTYNWSITDGGYVFSDTTISQPCNVTYTLGNDNLTNIYFEWLPITHSENTSFTQSISVQNSLVSYPLFTANNTVNNYTYETNKSTFLKGTYNTTIFIEDTNNANASFTSECTFDICVNSWQPILGNCTVAGIQTKVYTDINNCEFQYDVPEDNGTMTSCTPATQVSITLNEDGTQLIIYVLAGIFIFLVFLWIKTGNFLFGGLTTFFSVLLTLYFNSVFNEGIILIGMLFLNLAVLLITILQIRKTK